MGDLASDGDRDFQHTIPLAGEEIIGFFDVIKLEPVRNERFQVDAPCRNYLHELPHPFFATRASSSENFKSAYSLSEGLNGNRKILILRVNANAR
jgi:hypothetical protein